MAKIAGRKNEGAWQLFNNWLVDHAGPDAAGFEEALEGSANLMAAWELISETYGGYGVTMPVEMATFTDWCTSMIIGGIPLDMWMGKVSYDFYTKTTVGGETVYKPILGPTVALAAIDIRALAKLYQFADRQATWLARDTHPIPAGMRLAKRSPEGIAYRASQAKKTRDAIAARIELRPVPVPRLSPAKMPRKKPLTASKK